MPDGFLLTEVYTLHRVEARVAVVSANDKHFGFDGCCGDITALPADQLKHNGGHFERDM